MKEDIKLVKPDELKRLQDKAKAKREVTQEPQTFESDFQPAINTGGTVEILFETNGRFGNPDKLIMKDMHGLHTESIVTAKEDKLLETLVSCLNECVVEPKGFDVSNLTNDEFYELMLGMKVSFDAVELKHRWYHSCQDNVPEKDRELSESGIDLRNVQTVSIEESDEELRTFARARFDEYDDDQFKTYLISKYGKIVPISREQEVQEIKVKEPIIIPFHAGSYEYNFMRIKYLIEAHRLASKEFDPKIRIESNKSYRDMSKEEMQATREAKIEDINREKAKKFLNYSQAMCLVAKNTKDGRVVFETLEEKIKERSTIPRNVSMNYMKACQTIKVGVNHECELECNLCEDGVERRLLQRIITPYELIPISDSPRDFTSRGLQQPTGFDFHF